MSAEDIQQRSSDAAQAIADAADAAIARLHADPSEASRPATARLACRRCGHQDDAPEGALDGVVTCDVCGARIAFGRTIPRVLIEPTSDSRFVSLSFDGVLLLIDRPFANILGRELLSVCPDDGTPAAPVLDEARLAAATVKAKEFMASLHAELVAAKIGEPK